MMAVDPFEVVAHIRYRWTRPISQIEELVAAMGLSKTHIMENKMMIFCTQMNSFPFAQLVSVFFLHANDNFLSEFTLERSRFSLYYFPNWPYIFLENNNAWEFVDFEPVAVESHEWTSNIDSQQLTQVFPSNANALL